uniref:Uncharacterized protein n=1 Tax=Anguilla anguilla TaxID=7936 RepID=A0A0E9WLT2_ANGAN
MVRLNSAFLMDDVCVVLCITFTSVLCFRTLAF